jgi:predicted RND superfamily exporter protein
MHTGDLSWTWSATEKGLVDGLFLGLGICFPVAFVVLTLATMNIIASTFAILAIAAIVTTVLGFCEAIMDWPLGIGESVAGIIVIGFSVDYVVHLGHMLEEADQKGFTSRIERFEYAASKMGSTIVAGAITTGGSAMFMFVCQMTFFTKMATLITITILLSFVFSLGFFMGLLVLVGPEGGQGKISCSGGHDAATETGAGPAQGGKASAAGQV